MLGVRCRKINYALLDKGKVAEGEDEDLRERPPSQGSKKSSRISLARAPKLPYPSAMLTIPHTPEAPPIVSSVAPQRLLIQTPACSGGSKDINCR